MKGSKETMTLTERQKILLLFMAASPTKELSPIKIMKGMFVINERQKALLPKDGRYEFHPYLFGPFTPDIYRDLEILEQHGLLASRNLPGMIWRFYQATRQGKSVAKEFSENYPKELVDYIRKVKQWVTQTPLSDILRAIYREFPQYTVQSIAYVE